MVILDQLEDILEIEVLNDGSNWDKDYILIKECSESRWAENNCASVSNEVAEQYGVGQIELNYGANCHWALLEGNKVIDFTARQYDQTLDFPLVMKKDAWIDLIKSYTIHQGSENTVVIEH